MKNTLAKCVLLGVGLMLSGSAFAQDQKEYICQSLDPSQSSYAVQCRVENGVIDESDESCGCGGGFVLVDPEIQPAVGPSPNVVSGG